ncbi:serine hydrolase domain-containing protein [Paenibacillus polygoni]|uniref:Serine hydrolase domain-containing protein n=1 Tax=Paenibacillus polygoni TaxID=3050112 RepID=A0ABY8X6P9_9BACL|nr:serine hydrolase domain-containing protein [Paenibacillus polygoni]WIV21210.1 serine hydrolase domain-containing protein [Paenibacillus polygoni]
MAALTDKFSPLISYTEKAKVRFGASAASVVIIQDNKIITEWYTGEHHFKNGALVVTTDSMFNLYSLRKTYVGLATAIAVVESRVSIDSKVSDVLINLTEYELGNITIRDLATKSGAKYFGSHRVEREKVACDLIKELTGSNIAELITERICRPAELTNTEWVSIPKEKLVCDFQAADGYASVRIESNEGHERNLYSSARDLARWGDLHLNKGFINSSQLVPATVFTLIEQLRMDTGDMKRIFGWYYQDQCYYASGAAGCHCVIVPEFNAVAVRMLNKYTENYTQDQNSFNEIFYNCLQSIN